MPRPVKKAAAVRAPAKQAAPKQAARKKDAAFDKVRALCLALPEAKLTMTWGSPHFRVGEKIFCGFGTEKDGRQVMSVKLELDHARRVVKEPRFWASPYVGKHGWVTLDVAQRESWDEVAKLIHESYGLIAPRRSARKR